MRASRRSFSQRLGGLPGVLGRLKDEVEVEGEGGSCGVG